jgi:hypothetical protein
MFKGTSDLRPDQLVTAQVLPNLAKKCGIRDIGRCHLSGIPLQKGKKIPLTWHGPIFGEKDFGGFLKK